MTYQASKWLKVGILADPDEIFDLMGALPSVFLYQLGKVVQEPEISKEMFNAEYKDGIDALKQGSVVPFKSLPLVMTLEKEAVSIKSVPNRGYLVQIKEPAVQIQAHSFRYSPVDQSIRAGVLGADSIAWGLQFSYPQIYQEPDTQEIVSTLKRPNAALWNAFRQWLRDKTVPTPFSLNGKILHSPIRIGKKCLSWISHHPQLTQELYVRR
jgi:hypothetical protein